MQIYTHTHPHSQRERERERGGGGRIDMRTPNRWINWSEEQDKTNDWPITLGFYSKTHTHTHAPLKNSLRMTKHQSDITDNYIQPNGVTRASWSQQQTDHYNLLLGSSTDYISHLQCLVLLDPESSRQFRAGHGLVDIETERLCLHWSECDWKLKPR